jgi:hypothetical protein
MRAQQTRQVTLLEVTPEEAAAALDSFENRCRSHGIETDEIDQLWKLAQLVSSYLLLASGALPAPEDVPDGDEH